MTKSPDTKTLLVGLLSTTVIGTLKDIGPGIFIGFMGYSCWWIAAWACIPALTIVVSGHDAIKEVISETDVYDWKTHGITGFVIAFIGYSMLSLLGYIVGFMIGWVSSALFG